eukprot:4900447-Pleurochrysis_carterae.AAC.4
MTACFGDQIAACWRGSELQADDAVPEGVQRVMLERGGFQVYYEARGQEYVMHGCARREHRPLAQRVVVLYNEMLRLEIVLSQNLAKGGRQSCVELVDRAHVVEREVDLRRLCLLRDDETDADRGASVVVGGCHGRPHPG